VVLLKVRLQTGQSTLDKKLEVVLTFTGNPNPQIKGFPAEPASNHYI
jgi:hypothetical protein